MNIDLLCGHATLINAGCTACAKKDLESQLAAAEAKISQFAQLLRSAGEREGKLMAELAALNSRGEWALGKYADAADTVERMRAALSDIASHCCHPDCNHQEVATVALSHTAERAEE